MKKSFCCRLVAIATFLSLSVMCMPGRAAIIMTFSGSGQLADPFGITLSDVDTAVAVDGSATTQGITAAGTLASGSGSIVMSVQAFSGMTFSGTDLTLTGDPNIARNNSNGWSVFGGPISPLISNDSGVQNALTFTFDLSGLTLPALTELRLIGLTIAQETGSQEVEISLDGVSTTNLGNNTSFVTSVDLSDGDLLAVSSALSAPTEGFRLRTFTFDTVTIPEPSGIVLSVIGLIGVCALGRRKRCYVKA